MNTTETNRGRRRMTIILTVCFVAVLAIGGTLAWLTTTTDQKDNAFNVATADGEDPDMKAELTEPNWKPEDAGALRPGQSIAKDPTITNASKLEIPEWVGIKLIFTKGDGTTELTSAEMDVLNDVISYTPHANWMRKNVSLAPESQEIFYYKTKLDKDESTDPLFSIVDIKTSAENEKLRIIKDEWNGFKIIVKGAAVQGDMPGGPTTNALVRDELDGLLQ